MGDVIDTLKTDIVKTGRAPSASDRAPAARFMPPGDFDQRALARTLDEIAELGLNDNLQELQTHGYTVVKGVLSPETVARAKAAILARAERKSNRQIDPDAATTDDFQGMAYQHYLLFADPVFEEILLERKPLALMKYLLGESMILSSMGSHFRGPGGFPLGVHADGAGPAPFSATSMVANCNYALTPYTKEQGALMMFPGSHLRQRAPTWVENWTADGVSMGEIMARKLPPAELDAVDWKEPPGGVTMAIDPGDAVIWHGNTWHGGHRRDVPGVRMNLAVYCCRPHYSTQERRGDERHDEVFARHADDPRFARLLGRSVYNGWREEGPDNSGARYVPRGYFD